MYFVLKKLKGGNVKETGRKEKLKKDKYLQKRG
jgi:hypothetical protein